MIARSKGVHDDRPMSLMLTALSFLLGIVALMGLSSAVQLVGWVILVDDFVWDSAQGRRVMIVLPVSLLMGGAALWGLMRLKPWRGKGEPLSPTTRKTNALILLSGVVSVPGGLALFYDAFSRDNPWAFYSNSAISAGIAVFAIASWLLSMAISWSYYFGADEHARRANDFGLVAGGGLFLTVTPAWWVAARAGLLPQLDAMVLWCVAAGVGTIGWFWYRYR
jgi:hypothetical protein